VGWAATSLRRVRLGEAGDGAPEEPWAEVEEARADVNLFQLIGGGTLRPGRITLRGTHLLLRFDRNGKLLTQLPRREGPIGEVPLLAVRDSQITLRQEGRDAGLTIKGVTADVGSEGDRLVLEGTIEDPEWSGWSVAGEFDRGTEVGTLVLRTDEVAVSPEMLDRLPCISPDVWKQVQLDGKSPVVLTLRSDPRAGAVHYHALLGPSSMVVDLPAMKLRVVEAHGRLTVEDGLVRLEYAKGKMAGGTVRAEGTIDFRTPPGQLDIGVTAQGLDVKRLPKGWALPKGTAGQLSGEFRFRHPLDGVAKGEK
jgi:hypothetical protein